MPTPPKFKAAADLFLLTRLAVWLGTCMALARATSTVPVPVVGPEWPSSLHFDPVPLQTGDTDRAGGPSRGPGRRRHGRHGWRGGPCARRPTPWPACRWCNQMYSRSNSLIPSKITVCINAGGAVVRTAMQCAWSSRFKSLHYTLFCQFRYTEIYWDKPTISGDDHGILRDKHNRCWDNHHIFQYFNLLRYTQLNLVYWSISRYMCGTTGIIFHEKLSRAMLWDSCNTAEISRVWHQLYRDVQVVSFPGKTR